MAYIRVQHDKDASNIVEVPLEDDGTLLLSTLKSQFTAAQGLKYFNPDTSTYRAVRLKGDSLIIPVIDLNKIFTVVRVDPLYDTGAKVDEEKKEVSVDSLHSDRDRDRERRGEIVLPATDVATEGPHPSMPTFDGNCYLCGARGHSKAMCPMRASSTICYKCGQPGHMSRQCPTLTGATVGVGTPAASMNQYSMPAFNAQQAYAMPEQLAMHFNTIKCFRCQQAGHIASQCPIVHSQNYPSY